MDVTNSNVVTVEELFTRMFDIYGQPQTFSRDVDLDPQKTIDVQMLKQGIIEKVEIIPVVVKSKKRIRCESRKLEFSDIEIC